MPIVYVALIACIWKVRGGKVFPALRRIFCERRMRALSAGGRRVAAFRFDFRVAKSSACAIEGLPCWAKP
jgi:hypothetical protein